MSQTASRSGRPCAAFDEADPSRQRPIGSGKRSRQTLVAAARAGKARPNASIVSVAVVAARLQARPERVPVDLAGAGDAAVVLRDVDVDRLGRARGDRLRLVLLLDVRVEAVVHHLQRRVVDRADEAGRVGGGRQEVVLEPVEVLDREPDVPRLGLLGDLAQGVDAGLELVVGRPVAREVADGRVDRPAEDLAVERRAAVEDLLEVGDGRLRGSAGRARSGWSRAS